MTAEEIIRLLHLQPHPEGGYFAETYRSAESISRERLPERYSGPRSFGTAIYFFLTPDTFSALHQLESDELFHFYAGSPVELFMLDGTGQGSFHLLGNDLASGALPQLVVPRGTWQGCRLKTGGEWALLGTTVAPGFNYEDFRMAERGTLIADFPTWQETILSYTR